MNITEAASMARTLMNANGLGHVPFEFDRSKSRIGATHFRRATGEVTRITLSRYFAETLSEAQITNTILHEIAHAKAGHSAGHGPVWKSQAMALGIKPERCASGISRDLAPAPAWIGVCPNGHKTSGQHRAPLRVKSCGKCHATFNPDYLYTWQKNGKTVPVESMPERYRAEFRRIKFRNAFLTY